MPLHLHEDSSHVPHIVTGAVSPQNAPDKVGDIYIDTVTKDVYIATGTLGYGDWILVSDS